MAADHTTGVAGLSTRHAFDAGVDNVVERRRSESPSMSRLPDSASAEAQRLEEDRHRRHNWKRWGPYLAERQWGTVREDYSADGTCWEYFPHEQARSRAYRWGEDGLLGLCDRQGRLCFAVALWNERDPILKERLFGLTNNEANHGEDVGHVLELLIREA